MSNLSWSALAPSATLKLKMAPQGKCSKGSKRPVVQAPTLITNTPLFDIVGTAPCPGRWGHCVAAVCQLLPIEQTYNMRYGCYCAAKAASSSPPAPQHPGAQTDVDIRGLVINGSGTMAGMYMHVNGGVNATLKLKASAQRAARRAAALRRAPGTVLGHCGGMEVQGLQDECTRFLETTTEWSLPRISTIPRRTWTLPIATPPTQEVACTPTVTLRSRWGAGGSQTEV